MTKYLLTEDRLLALLRDATKWDILSAFCDEGRDLAGFEDYKEDYLAEMSASTGETFLSTDDLAKHWLCEYEYEKVKE